MQMRWMSVRPGPARSPVSIAQCSAAQLSLCMYVSDGAVGNQSDGLAFLPSFSLSPFARSHRGFSKEQSVSQRQSDQIGAKLTTQGAKLVTLISGDDVPGGVAKEAM